MGSIHILKSLAALHGIILSERHLHWFVRMQTVSETTHFFVHTICLKGGNKLLYRAHDLLEARELIRKLCTQFSKSRDEIRKLCAHLLFFLDVMCSAP